MTGEPLPQYDDLVLRYAAIYAPTALDAAAKIGLSSPWPALGAILEEVSDRYASFGDTFVQDYADVHVDYLSRTYDSHSKIEAAYNQLLSRGPNYRLAIKGIHKFGEPILIDVGPGNIQPFTAIRLLREYNDRYGSADPLDLKKYNNNYNHFVEDLLDEYSPTGVRIATLMIDEAYRWGSSNVSNWSALTAFEKEGFAVFYYRVGQEAMNKRLAESGTIEYVVDIDNTDHAQEFLLNRDEILDASDSENPFYTATGKLILEDSFCFGAGTIISTPSGQPRAIESLAVGDLVVSPVRDGRLVAGKVTVIHINTAAHLLDVFGLKVTPGHHVLCGDGPYVGRHVPIIDILRTDGALVREDGSLVRAATNFDVGSREDQKIEVAYLESKDDEEHKSAYLRLGSRLPHAEKGAETLLALLEREGYGILEDGRVQPPGEEPGPLYFFGAPPRPEDYVLGRSGLTLSDIYDTPDPGAWEGHLPNPLASSGGRGSVNASFTQRRRPH